MTYKSQTVSAVIITYNNVATLERALSSLRWVDEIVVMDRGSTDGTLAIARGFTDKVFYHPSSNPVILRRDALTSAQGDWLLLIEPDEWVEEMLRHEIDGAMLHTPAHLNGYTIPRKLKFQNRFLFGPVGEEPSRVLRLVRKNHWEVCNNWSAELRVGGDVGRLDRPLGYAPYATVDDLFAAINGHSTRAAYEHLDTYGFRPADVGMWRLLWRLKADFLYHFLFQGGLWHGALGITLGVANMVNTFLKYAKIRALM